MKRIPYVLLFLVLLSCSNELRVHSDFDKDVEIHRLTSFGWLQEGAIEARNNPLYFNELNDKRVKTAVEKQMLGKGYRLSLSFAQIIIHYHIIVENRVSINPELFGYNYGRYFMRNEVDTYRYNEGTLILDFMDSQNCNLIWRGWAVSILDDENLISEDLINKAVKDIFERFPMAAAKEVLQP